MTHSGDKQEFSIYWKQRQKKKRSRDEIIKAFLANRYNGERGRVEKEIGRATWTQLRVITGLSESTLSERLNELLKEGLVRKVSSIVEGDYYKFTPKAIRDTIIYSHTFADQSILLFRQSGEYHDIDSIIADFSNKLGALATYVIIKALTMGLTAREKNEFLAISPAEEWLSTSINLWHVIFQFSESLTKQMSRTGTVSDRLYIKMNLPSLGLRPNDKAYQEIEKAFERVHPDISKSIKWVESTVKEIL